MYATKIGNAIKIYAGFAAPTLTVRLGPGADDKSRDAGYGLTADDWDTAIGLLKQLATQDHGAVSQPTQHDTFTVR